MSLATFIERWIRADHTLEYFLIVALAVTLVSGVACVVARAFARRAAVRHVVLLSALIACLSIPAITALCFATRVSVVSVPVLTDSRAQPVVNLQASRDLGNRFAPVSRSQLGPSEPGASVASAERSTPSLPTSPPPAARHNPAPPAFKPRVDPAPSRPLTFRDIAAAMIVIWLAGTLAMLARFVVQCTRVMRLRRSSQPLVRDACAAMFEQIAATLGMKRTPALLVSDRVRTPIAVGLGRPAVIVPRRLLDAIGADELRDVFLHEIAHLRRGDQHIVLAQAIVAALYWPLVSVHALNRALRRAREEICDNIVLTCGDAIRYGRTLLHVAEVLDHPRPTFAAAGMYGSAGELEGRIVRLIDPRRNTSATAGRTTAWPTGLAFTAAVVIACATRFAASAPPPPPPPPVAQSAPSELESDPDSTRVHFSGVIKDPDGKPFAGARLYVEPLPEGYDDGVRPQRPLKVRAVADVGGRFDFDAPDMTKIDFDGLPARIACVLSATADGYGPDWIILPARDRSRKGVHRHNSTGITLRLARDDIPIHGRFLDPDGKPLAGVRVSVDDLIIPTDRDLDAHIEREKKYSWASDGSNWEKSLGRPWLLPIDAEATTDADGRFKLTGLGRDRVVRLSALPPDSVIEGGLSVLTRDTPDIEVRLGNDGIVRLDARMRQFFRGAGFTFKFEPRRRFTGVVRDADTHRPLAGMWVGHGHENDSRLKLVMRHVVTDAGGRFAFTMPSDWESWVIGAASPPGMLYIASNVKVAKDFTGDVVIDCKRGIPYRLKLVDEQGKLVSGAVVTSDDVRPNPLAPRVSNLPTAWPLSTAVERGNGVYEGFVTPGPGVVLVETPNFAEYRPAMVDPRAFFAPGKPPETLKEWDFGDRETISASLGPLEQTNYAAIVLVNPPANSGALELSATFMKDHPRQVSLVDPDGKPVTGVHTRGMTAYPYDLEMPLRATFTLRKLHPERARRITFLQDDRKLIGFLAARGDADMPLTVRMQPWATVTGHLVGRDGKPATGSLVVRNPESQSDSWLRASDQPSVSTDANGYFRVETLVPGSSYKAEAYRDFKRIGVAFENLTLVPGESRDVGEVRVESGGNN